MPPPKFQTPERIEVQYRSAMRKLLSAMMPSANSSNLLMRLEELSMQADLVEMGNSIASRMVQSVNVVNARSWREASARSQRSRMLYNRLQKEMQGSTGQRVRILTHENAQLIRSIPLDVAQQLNHEILRAQQQGSRPETIAKMMANRYPELTTSKINVIARTETSKASTALTQARAEDLDLDWFEWHTSEDQRVRLSHKKMDKVLVNWKDLPSPERLAGEKSTLGQYAPGAAPNCRCYPAPLLSVDDVSWPHRVYSGGAITRMTRAQFMRLAGAPVRRIAA